MFWGRTGNLFEGGNLLEGEKAKEKEKGTPSSRTGACDEQGDKNLVKPEDYINL